MAIFRDRVEAGKLLAEKLLAYENDSSVLVLALPRGGVPVAFEITRRLKVPLDVFLVRKLGVPGHEELAMGALALGDIEVLNEEIIDQLNIPPEAIDAIKAKEQQELQRRNLVYRGNRKFPNLKNLTVILVDDGVATGATIRAAIKAIKKLGCKHLIVAIPVAPPATCAQLAKEADEVYCLATPEPFFAIGSWYQDFSQTTDDQVCHLLKADLKSR